MATDSLIGYGSVTFVAPEPTGNSTDSLIGYATATMVAPPAPYTSSLIGYATATLVAPAAKRNLIRTKKADGTWKPIAVRIFDGEKWGNRTPPFDPSLATDPGLLTSPSLLTRG